MIKCSVTIALVPEARGGPFVFWDDLATGCAKAAELGFSGVEIFPQNAGQVDRAQLAGLLSDHHLKLAAVGTGGGWVAQKLTLTNPDSQERTRAREFVKGIIDFAGSQDAPAIIGSMQGRHGNGVSRGQALEWLADGLNELGDHAASNGMPLLYEPLNRYETNLFNRVGEMAGFLAELETGNVKILADLFHMNIEEPDIAQGIRDGGARIGHVHFVDSNRQAAGFGHMNHAPVATALREIGFEGFVSAEAFPTPDPETAARQTMESFRKYFC